jgi:Arc/MetJ-type ribon-helix-helix transcriptional regulator
METTAKRTTIRLTKEDLRKLDLLIEKFGECPSQVIRRALNKLYDITFKEE